MGLILTAIGSVTGILIVNAIERRRPIKPLPEEEKGDETPRNPSMRVRETVTVLRQSPAEQQGGPSEQREPPPQQILREHVVTIHPSELREMETEGLTMPELPEKVKRKLSSRAEHWEGRATV